MRFLREAEVVQKVGLSRVTIWRLEKAGTFPNRRQISAGRVAWPSDEVDTWMQERPTAKGAHRQICSSQNDR